MYESYFISHDVAEYYHNEEFLFSSKREINFWKRGSVTSLLDKEDKMIFSFYNFDCTILYWKLKILSQKLNEMVSLEKVDLQYILVVHNKKISLRFSSNPFAKKIGKIYINKICVGEIEKVKTSFNFVFFENTELEYYCMILFSMYSVGITESP